MLLLQVIVGGLLLGAIYALFSSGLTLIWGMMNFINFAHGEFVMLGMYVALLVVVWLGGGPAVFGFAAAFCLFVLGIIIYVGLIRHVTRGPMLAQILSTFGLALLLRYTAFWLFSANIVSLPQNSLSGTLNIFGILVPTAQLVTGLTAAALTLAMHVFLTRTTMGSQLLAVAEDRQAAMLMGIRPDRMQALAWGLAAGGAGIAGALMAISFPWSPSVGETFGLQVFVAYPFVFSNAFYLDIGVALLLAAISASAWNIVGGYAGQVSVGHCMFFGAGAYLPLLFFHQWQLPPLVGVPAGVAVSLLIAV